MWKKLKILHYFLPGKCRDETQQPPEVCQCSLVTERHFVIIRPALPSLKGAQRALREADGCHHTEQLTLASEVAGHPGGVALCCMLPRSPGSPTVLSFLFGLM